MAKSKQLILQNVVLSFPHFDKAQEPQNPGDKPKFSGAFVLNAAQVEQVKAAAIEVAVEKWGPTKGPQMVTTGGKGSTIRTDLAKSGYDKIPGAAGYISARSEAQPGLVYRHADPASVTPEKPKGVAANVEKDKIRDVFYPGAKVNVSVTAFSYDKATNKGVGFALNHVQKWAEGDRLDGRKSIEETFEAEMAEAPASLQGLV